MYYSQACGGMDALENTFRTGEKNDRKKNVGYPINLFSYFLCNKQLFCN
jgi:hypothetical protein